MKGLIGWLSPEGHFHECRYGEHYELAEQIYEAKEKEMKQLRKKLSQGKRAYVDKQTIVTGCGYVALGCDAYGSGFIFFPYTPLTRKQIDWFFYNQHRLSPEQLEMWEWYCEQNCIETEEMAS